MSERALFDLTRRLIDTPSVTGDEEAVGSLIAAELSARRFHPRFQSVDDHRRNVYVLEPQTRVVFCTHMDTVAPYIPSSEDDTWIHGRGACDAKGILAAMVVAAQRLHERGHTDVGLLFLVGEETDSQGARVANTLDNEVAYVVVGEPTQGTLASGHKGVLALEITVQGRAAHSAYPHLGDSAIHRLLDLLDRLRTLDWGSDPVLGEATLNVGTIQGGVAMNVVAPSARATVAIRLVGSASDALDRLHEALGDDPAVQTRIVSRSDAVRCHTVEGFPSEPVAFGSDLFYLDRWGRPLLIGPGSIHVAHTDGERIAKRDLLDAVDIYVRLAERLLAS
ncbi:MAG: M20/M25/M40 family metallo-hydrolase [Gemmatimonadota bacterium]